MTTGITSLRKRATSSGSERICLRVIEQDQGDEKEDEQKEGEEQV